MKAEQCVADSSIPSLYAGSPSSNPLISSDTIDWERHYVRDNGCIHFRRGSKISRLHQEIEPFFFVLRSKWTQAQVHQRTIQSWSTLFDTHSKNGSQSPLPVHLFAAFPVITFSHNFPLSLNSLANPIIQSNCLHFSDSSTLFFLHSLSVVWVGQRLEERKEAWPALSNPEKLFFSLRIQCELRKSEGWGVITRQE